MFDVTAIWAAVVGGVMSSVPTALVAYRQGRAVEAQRREEDVERRLHELEVSMTTVVAENRAENLIRRLENERRKQQ